MTDTIIVIHETWIESAKRDLFSVICVGAIIGPGVFLGSSAMQWFGFLMLLVIVVSRVVGLRKKMGMTPDEAMAKIKELAGDTT